MQPELPEVHHHHPNQITSESFTNPTQHGRPFDDASPYPLLEHRGWVGPGLHTSQKSGNTSPPLQSFINANESARLSASSTPGRDRVTEYENALSPTPKKRPKDLEFQVIKKKRKPGDTSSPIADLPNEILTHALSHLPPNDLAAVAMVSRRFHSLVTTPHAWRMAFSRYFLGSESLLQTADSGSVDEDDDIFRTQRRSYTRLTALSSWRSEYIMRTRLLRSLARGKPTQVIASPAAARLGQSHTANTIFMYNSQLFTTVNHLHANFGSGLNKRPPRFIHGADDVGAASSSDPIAGKVDSWGVADPHLFYQFSERFPGDAQWGLGPGEIIGCPNVMDVSQPYGMIHGEGSPGGTLYFRHVEEPRGRFLALMDPEFADSTLGIPRYLRFIECFPSVWIAKSNIIPSMSDGLVGILAGHSTGILSTYSLGADGLGDRRIARGELTARWVLSPGVPIVAIAVDEAYSITRQAQNRIWAVALNALGEVFYLTKFPKRPNGPRPSGEEATEHLAWKIGRSVFWNLVEASRRTARVSPYRDTVDADGSYSPRSSWDGMFLSQAQVQAETREIEAYIQKQPKDFQRMCTGWDMRRRLEVDFAGDDGHHAGESVVVFRCGLDEDSIAEVKRYTRCNVEEKRANSSMAAAKIDTPPPSAGASLFGGPVESGASTPSDIPSHRGHSSSHLSLTTPENTNLVEEWRTYELSFAGMKSVQITTTAIDSSTYATMTVSEDPCLGFSSHSTASSSYASPQYSSGQPASPSDIPGQRARFVAAGTKTGNVILWDIRAPVAKSAEWTNTVEPLRIIYTDSPEISCLGLTALYVVHGGNDGLVQAWDPLASTMTPVRTLNSRFSSRARRRLVQAEASAQGVGINLFAAGAICLDPDPTALRGMVSLGTHLRYWAYSSSAADAYKSNKRRLRRSERGSNNGGEKFVAPSRGNLKHYIAKEQMEMERDAIEREREANRLAGRFGVDLLDDEETALAYAAFLSQEALQGEQKKRRESESSASVATKSLSVETHGDGTATPESSVPTSGVDSADAQPVPVQTDEELDADIAEAIRLSLQLQEQDTVPDNVPPSASADFQGFNESVDATPAFEIPIRYAKKHKSPTRRPDPSMASADEVAGSSKQQQVDEDLEYALQLSLAEEASRNAAAMADEEWEEFPALTPPTVKGKGKGRA